MCACKCVYMNIMFAHSRNSTNDSFINFKDRSSYSSPLSLDGFVVNNFFNLSINFYKYVNLGVWIFVFCSVIFYGSAYSVYFRGLQE